MADKEDRETRLAAIWLAVTAIVLAVGQWISVPGVNDEAMRALLAGDGSFELFDHYPPSRFNLFVLVGPVFLVARLIVMSLAKKSSVRRRIALAIVLLLVFIQG